MTLRITWKRTLATLLALFAAGMLFAWSGIFNVAASSGHWAATEWFLHWVMRNSVQTHAAFSAPNDPRDDRSLVSAAGHFAQACAVCHGAPGQRPSPTMQAAMPPAPDLAINARQWTDKHLFWILQHGVKYSGMPAWAASDRQDEVRRMVGFVRRLPTMTPAQYRSLVAAPPETSAPGLVAAPPATSAPGIDAALVARCTGCHGTDGCGRGQRDVPILGGQGADYLFAALRSYAAGARHSAVMQTAAAPLDTRQMAALARHFAAMPGIGDATAAGTPRAVRIVTRGLPAEQLPACTSCHAPGKGYPVLAGQRASYIAQRLRAWRGDETVVDARKSHATMPVIARRVPEDQIDPVARLLAGEAAPR